MSFVDRGIYLVALVAVAAVYTVLLPPESFTLWSLVKSMIPATSIGILFLLAKGVMGEGLMTHVGAFIVVFAVVALVTLGLSSTGLIVHVKTATGMVSAFANATNTTFGNILP